MDTFIKANGLGSGENTLTYLIEGQDKRDLSNKTKTEAIRRYNNAGWNASFVLTGSSPKEFVLIDPNG